MQHRAEATELLHADPPRDAAVPVLVLNVGRMVMHHGTVGIIRSLGRMGVPVYGIIEDRFTPAAVSRHLAGAFVWDTRGMDAQRFLEGMAVIGERLNRPAVVIPTGDLAAMLVAENATALRRWFVFPEQPPLLPRTLANKKELYQLCQKLGVPYPRTVFPDSLADVQHFLARATFPVVVKAAESWLLPPGHRTTLIARSQEHVLAIYQGIGPEGLSNLMLQEYVDAASGEDWFYHGYRNARSNCCVGFTGRKLRSYPVLSGPTTLGKSVANEPLRRQVEGLVEALSYSGILDLDYRLDTRDGQYKLLDFNPRIGAQFRLFEDDAGVDVARALYLDLTGARDLAPRPIQDRTFIADFHDLAATFAYFWRGKLTFRDWRRSLQGRRELAWFSLDDPLPFAVLCVRLMFQVARRLLRLGPAANVVKAPPRFVRCRKRAWRRNPPPSGRAPRGTQA
jgi:predicted ATP-grasp superfamily ATP-dependent carboligase